MTEGRFTIRVPKDLHEALVNQAKQQGVSLNLWCNLLLTAGYVSTNVVEKLAEDAIK